MPEDNGSTALPAGEPSPIRDAWLPPELAMDLYLAFEKGFGSRHSLLACYAAFPFILSPELVNLIRLNFVSDDHDLWIAEVDFLLSPLCTYQGQGLYQVDPGVREILLADLQGRTAGPAGVLYRLADFLLAYAHSSAVANLPPEVVRAYEWIAWSYLSPQYLVADMTRTLLGQGEDGSSLGAAGPLAAAAARRDQLRLALMLEMTGAPIESGADPESYRELLEAARVVAEYWRRGASPDAVGEPGEVSVSDARQPGKLARAMFERLQELETAAPEEDVRTEEEPPVEGELGKRPTEGFPDCCAVGDDARYYSSGVLVAPRLVITAKHAQGVSQVFLKGSDVNKPETGERIRVARDIPHPELDLRVLFLEQVASVAPRPIATGVEDAAPRESLFVGFGTIDRDGKTGFGRKRYVRIPITSLGCEARDEPKRYGCRQGQELVAGQIGLDRDSSKGDGGGPLYVASSDGSYLLLATSSRGMRGGTHESGDGGIYVRVDKVLDWLRTIAGDDPAYRVETVALAGPSEQSAA